MKSARYGIYYSPERETLGETVVDGMTLPTMRPPQSPYRMLPVSFDDLNDRLAAMPKMFVELDGSFVWKHHGEPEWQLDGNLIDRGPALDRIELFGSVSQAGFDQFIACLGCSSCQLLFHLTEREIWLDDIQLRRYLWSQ